ncbi:MAG TPA: thioesterase family protein [Candidatus Solibacter sp.]|nr:thioesterase family protein [Candidatus Solibacter sp.]
MAEFVMTYRGIVYPWQCDHMGHMNVMWYTGKFDEACWQLLSRIGLYPSRFAQDGTAMAAVEQQIQYKRELHAGDAVTIQSAVLEIKDKSVRMLHKMIDDLSGEVAATTMIVGVHLDATIRKAIRIPDDVRRRALEMKEEDLVGLLELTGCI